MVQLVTIAAVLVQAQAAPDSRPALAREALAAFAAKCVQCHGPEVPHPKAAFGFVTDLDRLVASGKYVRPGHPEDSEVWKEISEGDMPPDEAKAGPLSQGEKDAILAWIVAGAPGADDPNRAGSEAAPRRQRETPRGAMDGPGDGRACRSLATRAVVLFGRLHVLVTHFPVAMLIAAAGVECWSWVRSARAPSPLTRFCVWIGAVSAGAAGVMGWVHALDGFPSAAADPFTIAGLHRWIGTGAALLAPAAALMVERDARAARRSPLARAAILGLAGLVGVAAHFGGLLTHGPGFLSP